MECDEKNIKCNLIHLKNNLSIFSNEIFLNFPKIEKKITSEFVDIFFELEDNIKQLNFILNNYDPKVLEQSI